ncbi:MAG TPA: hypothetical protein PLM89_11955 [Anaerolineales bacterium]|nr:hypothetical protein [Anaerolineales bacterium]
MRNYSSEAKLIAMLLDRLERISADSIWAHRASGLRGSLLRAVEQYAEQRPPTVTSLKSSIRSAFYILNKAAKELK